MKDYSNYKHSDVTGKVIEAAYFVFNQLGHGFLESVYEKALEIQLTKMGMKAIRQQQVEVYFEGELVGDFRADLVVNDCVIVELKAVETLHERHEVQLVNYLKATEIEVGLLINFGEKIKIVRRVFSNDRKKHNQS